MKRAREEDNGAPPQAPAADGAEHNGQPGAEDGDDDDDEPIYRPSKSRMQVKKGTECPYLDTISRQNLDFDFEKCCSVSLSPVNVYACLVCGKYYQGRGPRTHAFTHALETEHHMFMKLADGRVFCLPEGYEVDDRSLDAIRFVLNPTFTAQQVKGLDSDSRWARALDGSEYMPGLVGLNNMRQNDYVNVVVQALSRVLPLRDFFLVPANYASCRSLLVQRFGELLRKIWNPKNFKGQVSPHEFMQAVMAASTKRFTIDKQSDIVDFLQWFLNTLHADLTGGKRKRPSIITRCFQATFCDVSVPELIAFCASAGYASALEAGNLGAQQQGKLKSMWMGEMEVATIAGTGKAAGSGADVVERVPFLLLGMDLPPAPLYKDTLEKNIIPQVAPGAPAAVVAVPHEVTGHVLAWQ